MSPDSLEQQEPHDYYEYAEAQSRSCPNPSHSRAQRHDLNLDPTSPPPGHIRHNSLETLLSICQPRFGLLKWRNRYSDGARLACEILKPRPPAALSSTAQTCIGRYCSLQSSSPSPPEQQASVRPNNVDENERGGGHGLLQSAINPH